MKSFRILVSGRVQGVNFRSMMKSYAEKDGLKGNVRNLDDGRVEIYAKCNEEEKDKLVDWLKSNPGFSKVQDVKVDSVKGRVKMNGFEIIKEKSFLKDQGKSAKNFVKKLWIC